MQHFRGWLVVKAHRPLHYAILGSRVMKKKRRLPTVDRETPFLVPTYAGGGLSCERQRLESIHPQAHASRKGDSFVSTNLGRELVDDKTSMITDEDSRRGLLFY